MTNPTIHSLPIWISVGLLLLCLLIGIVIRLIGETPIRTPRSEALREAKAVVKRRRMKSQRARNLLRLIAWILSFVQVIVGGTITSTIWTGASAETTSVLGVLVLVATLMGQWLRPGARAQAADQDVAILNKALRRASIMELRKYDEIDIVEYLYSILDSLDDVQSRDSDSNVPSDEKINRPKQADFAQPANAQTSTPSS